MDKPIQYFETTEYNKFSFFEENREINETWVNELVERIDKRNLLKENPIIVDSNFRVIEGQHRLKAAEQLQVPIYYILSDGIKSSDISMLNDNRKDWSYDNYLDHYASLGNQEYIKVKNFIDEFPWVRPYTVIVLSYSKARKNAGDMFKSGNFEFNESNARLICEQLQDFAEYIPKFVNDRTFIGTIVKFNQVQQYDHNIMLEQIKKHPDKIEAVRTELKCAKMLEEVYNWNRPGKYHLNISFLATHQYD